jgi:hypothetical protein
MMGVVLWPAARALDALPIAIAIAQSPIAHRCDALG